MDQFTLLVIVASAVTSIGLLTVGFLSGGRTKKVDEMELMPDCPEGICDGSGEVANIESDETGSYGAGTRPCVCRL